MAYNRKELTTQQHRAPDQMLSGSLTAFSAENTTAAVWNTTNIEDTMRILAQGIQTRANLVFIGKPNDSATLVGANKVFFMCENHGESAASIQTAVREAFTGYIPGGTWNIAAVVV